MTAPTTTPFDSAFWRGLERLHGHRCPMSILGARLGLAALNQLGEPRPGRRLSARYHHRTCALDGIQMATSCTLGNGNLHVEAQGEHFLVLWDTETRDQARVGLSEEALAQGRRYAELRKIAESLPEETAERRAVEEQSEALLRRLEAAPEASLVTVESPGQ